jgi:sarcosine oxidase subunit alpha
MTSVAWSPSLGQYIGLGFLKAGSKRIGETIKAVDSMRNNTVELTVVSPHFVDPEGERLRV